MNQKLLKIRNEQKAQKPEFERSQVNVKKQFKGKWRKGRGKTNKIRLGLKGKKCMPRLGFASPKDVCGLTPKGLRPVIINSLADFENIKDGDLAVIGGSVGKRKRALLVEEAKKRGIKVNVHSVDDYLNKIKSFVDERKREAKLKKDKRVKSKVEAEKKKEEKEKNKEGKREEKEIKENKKEIKNEGKETGQEEMRKKNENTNMKEIKKNEDAVVGENKKKTGKENTAEENK